MSTLMIVCIIITVVSIAMIIVGKKVDVDQCFVIGRLILGMIILFGWVVGGITIPVRDTQKIIERKEIEEVRAGLVYKDRVIIRDYDLVVTFKEITNSVVVITTRWNMYGGKIESISEYSVKVRLRE